MSFLKNSITDIPGVLLGHAQDMEALTGCSVIICPSGAIGGVDQRGGAPGTRETDLLHPMHLVNKVHAILLAGGSAFGLDAAAGVMRFLEEKEIGFDSGVIKVPIVPAAVIFDLGIGRADIRPDSTMGYTACKNATSIESAQGNVGAGAGATVGKILGPGQSMKSGLGMATMDAGNGLLISALAVVNAFGDVYDPETNKIIAGTRTLIKGPIKIGKDDYFADTVSTMASFTGKTILNFAGHHNTVVGAVVTNARLDKEETNKVAQMAHDGLARVIRPSHTMLDGDTIFALTTGKKAADINLVGAYAAEAFSKAIINGVRSAAHMANLPSASNLEID